VRRHEGRRGRRQRVCHPSALRDRLIAQFLAS
jgi:hypothetical protein